MSESQLKARFIFLVTVLGVGFWQVNQFYVQEHRLVQLLQEHQMVMQPLKQAFAESVHALGLKTFTPEKWDEVKDQYNL